MSMIDLSGAQWRKSSHSDQHGGECVEVAGLAPVVLDGQWRKSSRSDQHGGACVEVAGLVPTVAVRDSKDPEGPKLIIDANGWRMFTRAAKSGKHDLT